MTTCDAISLLPAHKQLLSSHIDNTTELINTMAMGYFMDV